MNSNIILIFLITLGAVGAFLSLVAFVLVGDPRAVSFSAEAPLTIIASCIPPMIFFMRKKLFPGVGRAYLTLGFSFLFAVILFVLAIEKYSFVFPNDIWIFSLHPIEPITFTISVLFILQGVAWYVKAENQTSL